MMLDVTTPRGKQSLADELAAAELFEKRYPRLRYAHTDKDTSAKIDAVLIADGNQIKGIVLTSCRYNCSLATFETKWDWEWMLTWRKLAIGAQLSKKMAAPLIGFLYIVRDQLLLTNKLYDHAGWNVPLRTEYTETQKTINGGTIVRLNAFIKMDNAKRIGGAA